MCLLCDFKASRRQVLRGGIASLASVGLAAHAQVDVGPPSSLRKLVSAEQVEGAAAKQYREMMSDADQQRALYPASHPQVRRLREIARRLVPHSQAWNPAAKDWNWEINLIHSDQINAFCMPGGKIAFYSGILDKLKLSNDEAAMIMGHEMAHALREHARAQMGKGSATNLGLRIGAALLGLGQVGDIAADLGTQLLSLQFSRSDETEADLVGLELAARGAFQPNASVTLWQKMAAASGGAASMSFLSTHPSSPDRIKTLQRNVPKVQVLFEQARAAG
jgi:Zn-dependent protease with chaperone function